MKRAFLSCTAVAVAFLIHMPAAHAKIEYPKQPPETTSIERMRSGTLSATSEKSKDALEGLAKWLAWRLDHPPFNGKEPPKKIPGPIENLDTLLDELDRKVTFPNLRVPPNEMQLEYAKEFGTVLDKELMYVMNESVEKLVKVNAARMLAAAGKLPYEGFTDTYLKIIADDKGKYPDEIKLFAFQGLRNQLAIANPVDPNRHFISTPAKLGDICKALDEFILHKYPEKMPSEQAQVIQFIRREAVRAMAQFKFSVIRAANGNILGKPVWTLLRVSRNDASVMPVYGFHVLERIEALIGICNMQPDKALNLDAVVYLVNATFEELGTWHNTDKTEVQTSPRHKPTIPWRITASRLNEALDTWKKNSAKNPLVKNAGIVAKFADLATSKCLAKIESEGLSAVPDNRPFSDWRQDPARKPKTNEVIAGDAETAFAVQ